MGGETEPIRVLIADDEPSVRDLLSVELGLEPDLTVVGLASDGPEAIDLARRLRPDVVVMDVRMPGCSGIAATRVIKESVPRVRVVMLTNSSDEQDISQSMLAGASRCLLKVGSTSDLPRVIRECAGEQ